MTSIVPTLPPNTTALERAIATACAELVNVPVPLRELWSSERCPVKLLPFLAWACSVDSWDDAWPEVQKRAMIKAAYFVHKHKGTVAAVRRVVEAMGYSIHITEWWQQVPPEATGTFRLDVGLQGQVLTPNMLLELERLVADAKPVSRHLIGLAIHLQVRGAICTGVATYHGDTMTVYPWIAEEIEVRAGHLLGAASYHGDTMTVYPWTAPQIEVRAALLLGAAPYTIDTMTIYP